MSHELRTPLNSLLILARQLEDNPDHNMTDTQVQYASVIRTSGNDLLNLLNSILELAKVESGTVTAELTDVSLAELRTNLLREFEYVGQEKGIGFTINLAKDTPDPIVTDPQRLQQILKNLLSNAFKFTEQGSVSVDVGVTSEGWNPELASLARAESVLALSVTDSGIGIKPEQHQRIFEAFAQGDGSTARLYGGTGLGLSISRELAGLLEGEITVTSVPGEGSTFSVFLPLGRVANTFTPAPIREGTTTPPERSGTNAADQVIARMKQSSNGERWSDLVSDDTFTGVKVLVVDDDFRNIFAMTALLERSHAEVTVAESGADAIAILGEKSDIQIVLMDIMMPVMDGYETIRAIRQIDYFRTLPIIAVTGKVMAGERQRCIDAGASDYIPKPVDSAEASRGRGTVASRDRGDGSHDS